MAEEKQDFESKKKGLFARNPELKKKVDDYLAKIPPEKRRDADLKFLKFLTGEVTWAELKGYPKDMLRQFAWYAFHQYQRKEYHSAEVLFKGLAILDHTNWYYRAALGATYQKQKNFDSAIQEYSKALLLKENELSSLANRAECYLLTHQEEEALKDISEVLKHDPQKKTNWGKKAGALKMILEKGE